MKTITLCFFLLTCFFATLSAQDFKKDMEATQAFYQKLDSYHGLVKTKAFKDATSQKVSSVKQVRIKKKGKLFRYEMDEVMTLVTKKYMITKDAKGKVLVCNQLSKEQKRANLVVPDIDLVLSSFKEVVYKGIVDGKKVYLGKSEDGVVETTEIHLDLSSGRFSKLIYYYHPRSNTGIGRAEITFEDVDLNPKFAASLFSEKTFVVIKGNKAKLKKAFAAYTLILSGGLMEF
ncbi:MAG: outer membrane lipoprotein carrier protein LolA [Saprospiraceae bacterium]